MSHRPAEGWAAEALRLLESSGLRRTLETIDGPQGPIVQLGGRDLINFSSNDYLGLARDERLVEASATAARLWGVGSGASRLVVGDLAPHARLEREVASLLGTEAALAFVSGYTANLGVLSTLVGPDDAVFSDALNHASLVDGCRLSRARVVIYPHGDVDALSQLLATTPARRRLVVTDAVFSMDGDRAPLPAIVDCCRRHGAALYVDEAHAFGVMGPSGAGLCAEMGLAGEVDLRMVTMGKAAGSHGAVVACGASMREWLVSRARSLVFATAPAPQVSGVSAVAVSLLREADDRRARLWSHIRRMSNALRAMGLEAGEASPIFSVVLGTPEAALAAADQLRADGMLVKPIRPPTVPAGTSRLRICLSSAHSPTQIALLLRALEPIVAQALSANRDVGSDR